MKHKFSPPIRTLLHETRTNVLFHNPEIARKEEEHRQLPPYENVPQGRWTSQEGRCPWLNYNRNYYREFGMSCEYPQSLDFRQILQIGLSWNALGHCWLLHGVGFVFAH